jgi:predicted PurR-regulated permease PerM
MEPKAGSMQQATPESGAPAAEQVKAQDQQPTIAAASQPPPPPATTAPPDVAAHAAVTFTPAQQRRHARIQSNALAMLAAGLLLTLMYLAKPILIVILFAILIAFMLDPIVELCRRFGLPRWAGALIAVLVLCGALYGIFHVTYNQASQFESELPKYSGNIRNVLNSVLSRAEHLRQTTQAVLPDSGSDRGTVTVRQSNNWISDLTSGALGFTETLLLAAFIPFLVFFMLSWQDHVRASTVMLFHKDNRETAYMTLGLIAQMIRGFIVGNAIIGVILAITSAVAFWILGVPNFFLIGAISGIVSLLPYLGPVIAIVPPVVVSIGSLTTGKFAGIAIVVVASHFIALNVLYPKIIGSRLQLNPLAVTLALLFWGWLWGAMGLVLAVPVTAALKIIFDHVDDLKAWGSWLGE